MPNRIASICPLLLMLCFLPLVGACKSNRVARKDCPTPADRNISTRDMVDAEAQAEFDQLISVEEIGSRSELVRKVAFEKAMRERNPASPYREKNILCLSGGGSFGAFSAGILCGWTARGDRPEFDVVTGISTGALIAPFAFLGPAYDAEMKRFYTTLTNKDVFKMQLLRGLWGESLADNTPLAEQVDSVLTSELIAQIACEHQKGRRLYVGTTAAESKRFVIWDIGAIACKGRPCDRSLIKQILLGSSAIPGFFPPQHIDVDLDGTCITERHIDGGVSQAIFMQMPYVPPEYRSQNPNTDLAGVNVFLIVAGKLYADLEKVKPTALTLAGKEISAMIYAQTRGDLQRIYTATMLAGMNYYLTAIPAEYPAPTSSNAFIPAILTSMFEEGVRLMCTGTAWRKTPPGIESGENFNVRRGTCLTQQVRGPISQTAPPIKHMDQHRRPLPLPSSNEGIPAVPLLR